MNRLLFWPRLQIRRNEYAVMHHKMVMNGFVDGINMVVYE